MRKYTIPSILFAAIFIVAITTMNIPASADPGNQVGVCCAWNEKIADRVLTYKVSGGNAEIQAAMISAIEDWDSELADLDLVQNTLKGKDGKADITVKFKKGGGVIAGQAVRSFDKGTSYVKSVQINISGKAFGNDNPAPIIQQVVRHEFGHALGLNHANFDGDLMSTTVGAGALDISACDVQGVLEANHWALVDDPANGKHMPHVNHVHC